MTNPDVARIINSDEVQAVVKPALAAMNTKIYKVNPYKSKTTMEALNPYRKVAAEMEERAKAQASKKKSKNTAKFRDASMAFYATMSADYLDHEEPPSAAFDVEEEED